MSTKLMGKWIATFISQLGVSYRRSPIVSEYQSGSFLGRLSKRLRMPIVHHAGERAPDMDVLLDNTQTRLHTLCLGTRHVLFFFAHRHNSERSLQAWQEIDALLKREYSNLVDAFLILPRLPVPGDSERTCTIYDENADIYVEYGISDDGLVLVRPDGYIAFLCCPVSLEQFRAYLESIFVISRTRLASTATPGEVESKR
jgi:hypothetical protein